MSKFHHPMLNGEVCRATTDKQTHKQTQKHTYRVKTEETLFDLQAFLNFLFAFKKEVSKTNMQHNFQTSDTRRTGPLFTFVK